MDLLILLVIFVVLLAINVPIAFALGFVGLYALLGAGFAPNVVVRQIYHGIDSFALMAIPFFIFAGQLMNEGKITDKLLDVADAMVGWIRGSLGHVNVVASVLFAGISGAAVSDVAAIGSMLIPAMEEKGYSREYSGAITAASSILGPIIPPSIPMIVFGGIMNISIAGLFAAGILPGLGLALIQMIINYIVVKKRGYEPRPSVTYEITHENKVYGFTLRILKYFANVLVSIKDGFLALVMIFIIFGGILGGVFTPTEAAAVAALYALIVTIFITRTVNAKSLWKTLKQVGSMTGMSLLIVSTGKIISHYFTVAGIPTMLSRYILNITSTPQGFLVIVAVLLLIVGCFMDLTASIIILAPILTPIAIKLGINPIHFGLVFVFTLNIGLITPPVGAVLFVTSSIGKVRFEDLVREILPFYISFIVILLLMIFYEPLTTYIPSVLGLM